MLFTLLRTTVLLLFLRSIFVLTLKKINVTNSFWIVLSHSQSSFYLILLFIRLHYFPVMSPSFTLSTHTHRQARVFFIWFRIVIITYCLQLHNTSVKTQFHSSFIKVSVFTTLLIWWPTAVAIVRQRNMFINTYRDVIRNTGKIFVWQQW